MKSIPVAILGATGLVGQRFVQLLADHPWFQVTVLAASDRSVGRRYADACRWLLPAPMPSRAGDLILQPVEAKLDCRLVFSALPTEVAGPVEERLAQAGHAVCSNASAHRLDADVPLLIPEVNADHTALIHAQRARRGWPGLLVTSANCSTTQLALVLRPLHDAFGLQRLSVFTMQAVSGAGYPGLAALDILGNVVPFIGGEEEKLEREAPKLLGVLEKERIVGAPFRLSAQCNRVPVQDGHTECISAEFKRHPTPEEVLATLDEFRPPAQVAALPSTPSRPIHIRTETDRPQPARDRDEEKGMAVSVGRVRPCPVLDVRFVVLGHNTVRGAAGGAIHNAELLVAQGWVN